MSPFTLCYFTKTSIKKTHDESRTTRTGCTIFYMCMCKVQACNGRPRHNNGFRENWITSGRMPMNFSDFLKIFCKISFIMFQRKFNLLIRNEFAYCLVARRLVGSLILCCKLFPQTSDCSNWGKFSYLTFQIA